MQVKQTPFEIQLAIQGGGAKICTLIAALDAVQSLQKEGVLKVKRIAGTSAGAIVGCLFAADIRMEDVRERLRQIPPEKFSELFPPPSAWSIGWGLIKRGRPLWSTDFIKEHLRYFFDKK